MKEREKRRKEVERWRRGSRAQRFDDPKFLETTAGVGAVCGFDCSDAFFLTRLLPSFFVVPGECVSPSRRWPELRRPVVRAVVGDSVGSHPTPGLR